MNNPRLAIQLMIAQAFLFTAETAAIHQIGSGASVMQLALIRAGGGIALALVMARGVGFAVLRTRQLSLQLLRGGVSLLYLWIMVYSFARLPFADATAISYTQVVYIAGLALLILGEPVNATRWAASTIAMLGALLIAKPAFSGIDGVYLVALFGAGLNSLAFVLNRYLQREDSEATTMLYTNAVMLLGNVPALAMTLPPAATLAWLPVMLVCGPLGMYLGILAVRRADASALAPYTLVRLLIAMLAGALVFCEPPDVSSAVGAALILGSCLLTAPIVLRTPRSRPASGRIPVAAKA